MPHQLGTTRSTETVPEDGKPSLITAVKVKGATAADNDFFEEAVKETEKVTCNDVENAYVDGAYQSEKNREFAKYKINIISGGLQGKPSRFDLNLKDDQTLEVTDKTTGDIKTAIPVKLDEWKIVLENADGKKSYRYFKKEHVDKAEVRCQVESIPFEEREKRNNVEAACSSMASIQETTRPDTAHFLSTACKQLQDALGRTCTVFSGLTTN